MARRQTKPKLKDRCAECGQIVPVYDMVNLGSPELGYRELCGRCYNRDAADAMGVEEFEDATFEPVSVRDCTGARHRFHFRTRLFGPGVAIDAFELVGGFPGGYQFQVIGDPSDDLFVLFGKLIEKVRRHLSVRHIVLEQGCASICRDGLVRARITSDPEDEAPMLVIDGQDYTWDEFGRLLKTYEGWHFQLRVHDKSQE